MDSNWPVPPPGDYRYSQDPPGRVLAYPYTIFRATLPTTKTALCPCFCVGSLPATYRASTSPTDLIQPFALLKDLELTPAFSDRDSCAVGKEFRRSPHYTCSHVADIDYGISPHFLSLDNHPTSG